MRNYVIINGVNSLTIQGLAINNLPPITKPMIRTQREEIDGRDGDIVTKLGYSAYDKQMEIGLYGNFDIDAIIKYFTGDGTIVFSNEADKYYNFKILDQIDYEKLLKFKTATITMHCQPFKYPLEEEPVEAEITTITGTGESITLENVEEAPMKIVYKGNTYQDSTTGKNLFNINATKTDFSLYLYKYEYQLEPNTNYTVSSNCPYSGTASIYANGTSSGSNNVDITHSRTITSDSNGAFYILVRHLAQSELETIDVYSKLLDGTYYLQIEKGSSATSYEPYTNGASPNPDYPQPIQVVSGDNEITICGKNLIDTIEYNRGINSSGVISGVDNHYLGINDFVPCKPSTTYSITFEHDISTLSLYIGYKDKNGNFLNRTSSSSRTFTTPNNAYYLFAYVYKDDRFNVSGGYVQLEYGTPTPYEPYTSQSYPINLPEGMELCKIGTYQDKIDKSTGKNLFDEEYELGTINFDTGALESSTAIIRTKNYQSIKPSTQYTLKVPNEVTGIILYYYNNGSYIGGVQPTIGSSTHTTTFTTNASANQVKWRFNSNYTTLNNQTMLNEGTTALPYEPYGTSWYLKKEIGKQSISSLWWNLYNASGQTPRRFGLSGTKWFANGLPLKCNCFIAGDYNSQIDLSIWIQTGYLAITDKNSKWESANDLMTWLNNNDTILYYPLKTPTYTLIEGELLNQLEAIKMSYEGQTNISQINNDMPFELDASVTFLTPMEINNIGNIYAKPILTIEGTGNIGVVLNGIQILEIDLTNNGKITIDVPKLEAYNPDDDSLLNRLVTGDYMKLLINEGENKITFTGEVSGAILTNYIRWI